MTAVAFGLCFLGVAIFFGLSEIASAIRRQTWTVNLPPNIDVNIKQRRDD